MTTEREAHLMTSLSLQGDDVLRVAVISDVHAEINPEPDRPYSFLNMDIPAGDPRNPIGALCRLISGPEKLTADIIVCPGDLGCKARPATVQYGWQQLHRLAADLKSQLIIAAPGNHDFDSRCRYGNYEPSQVLKNLSPLFPFADKATNDDFWANHWVCLCNDLLRVILVDSSAYHASPAEIEHGRIAEETLHQIEQKLKSQGNRSLNLLVCHHHPEKHEDLHAADYDHMQGGQALIDQVCSSVFGHWLVIHGHRHHPKLYYARGATQDTPVVFSAGSLCAVLSPELATIARNQFYLLELTPSLFDQSGSCVGRFRSWDWACGRGWNPAGDGSGLPPRGGFGLRVPPQQLADKIDESFPEQLVKRAVILERMPQLDFLTPDGLEEMCRVLNERHRMDVTLDRGQISEIGRMI